MHERMDRATQLWLREVGRRDPLIPDNYWSAGERTMGEFGLIAAAREEQDKIQLAHNKAFGRTYNLRPDKQRKRRAEIDATWRAARKEFQEKLKGLRPDVYRHVKFHHDRIVYHDGADSVELARIIGTRRNLEAARRTKKKGEFQATMLLNGDGFDDQSMQAIQAELRARTQRAFGARQVMVIPFIPLAAAGIRIETMKRIEAARDGQDTVRVPIGRIPDDLIERLRQRATAATPPIDPTSPGRWRQSTIVSEEWTWGKIDLQLGGQETLRKETWRIMYQPEHGTPGMHTISGMNEGKPWIAAVVHRLGASVFSAVGPDGNRHRYVSAFDTSERPPMYFLAQLPDAGRCHGYDDAISLLAPPIVHASRQRGKRIYRQGDVFFIETTLTDQEIRKRGGTIHTGVSMRTQLPVRTRNIYGTGHVATRVARLKNGVTLANGIAEHVPALTEPGRAPEHRRISLDGAQWFLCCRNTVPRSANQDSATRRDTTRRRRTNARSTDTA